MSRLLEYRVLKDLESRALVLESFAESDLVVAHTICKEILHTLDGCMTVVNQLDVRSLEFTQELSVSGAYGACLCCKQGC